MTKSSSNHESVSLLEKRLSFACPSFFFNAPPTTEIYTLSLHDALPICEREIGAEHRHRLAPCRSANRSRRRPSRSGTLGDHAHGQPPSGIGTSHITTVTGASRRHARTAYAQRKALLRRPLAGAGRHSGVSALSVWASGVPKARVYGKWIGSTSKGFLIHAPRSTTDVAATDPALNWSDLDRKAVDTVR